MTSELWIWALIYILLLIMGVIGVLGLFSKISARSTDSDSGDKKNTPVALGEKENNLQKQIDELEKSIKALSKDRKLILDGIDKLNSQIENLGNIPGNPQSFDTLAQIPTILDLLQTLKSAKQSQGLNNSDKEFIEQTLSHFSQAMDELLEKQKTELQSSELAESFNKKVDRIDKTIQDIINAQGYKTCGDCRNSAVPKNAIFCPQCAGKKFVSNLPS